MVQMVMDLKAVVCKLREENQSLTKAFLWLCSGNADWQTLVQTLPQNLCEQLPSSVPLLLTGLQAVSGSSASGAASDAKKPVDAEQSLPPTPKLPGTPALAPRSEGSRRQNSAHLHKNMTQSKCRSPPVRGRSASRQADERPYSRCSNSDEGVAHRFLEQFPELAALESEFQDLVCRPVTE